MENKRVSILEKELERVQAQAAETQSKLDQISNISHNKIRAPTTTHSEPPYNTGTPPSTSLGI